MIAKYHSGDAFTCPHCGMRSEVKSEPIVTGLMEVTGHRLVCAFCGWELPAEMVASDAAAAPAAAKHAGSAGKDSAALDALFGDHAVQESAPLSNGPTHFCRDCMHYISNPFLSRCLKKNKNVEPLQVCEQFRPRHEENSDASKA